MITRQLLGWLFAGTCAASLLVTLGMIWLHFSSMGTNLWSIIAAWPIYLVLLPCAIGVIGAYFLILPPIRENRASESMPANPYELVLNLLKPDEKSVIEFLRRSGGTCTQRDIATGTEFTRLRTHRIIARLAERQLVSVKRIGKTNEISLPRWISLTNILKDGSS